MKKFGGEKGECGYIKSQKVFQGLVILAYVIVAVLIFLLGLRISHTRANIFTVVAVLMVLPATKRIIAFFVMIPHESISTDLYERVKKIVGDKGQILCDYIFTSSEKIMSLNIVVIMGDDLYAYSFTDKDFEYMTDFIKGRLEAISEDVSLDYYIIEKDFIAALEKAVKEEHNYETGDNISEENMSNAIKKEMLIYAV